MASPRKWLLPSKWLLPENGFSSEITSPQEIQNKSHFNLRDSWLLPMWTWSLLLDENVVWQSLHPKYFRFGIILEKQLTPVAKVGFFNILYHKIRYCQGKAIAPGEFVCICLVNDLNMHGVPSIVCTIIIINHRDMWYLVQGCPNSRSGRHTYQWQYQWHSGYKLKQAQV